MHLGEIPEILALIVRDAFTGEAAAGGAVGSVIYTGIRRSAFSNEAGVGTEAMAHGAARTNEPVREGLVAMLGPMLDTLIVCTATAMIILSSGVWRESDANGVTLTAEAFEANLPGFGPYILVVCVFFFAISTMFTFTYYGQKSLGFLIGAKRQGLYKYFYVATILAGAVTSLTAVINLTDAMFALMAIPTMTSALWLAPQAMRAARDYFGRLEAARRPGPLSP
jgi:AGCS family alanine or glycine:cation symporter